ncbi:class I adenylate-forming enzyme family protein [Achromobacter insolitus]|uniref:class I adenylate-forming enzyme family protein n=1 Tax=Achromobacter insolitus TaxID=217204 RepID=UPI00053669B6|nr:AMP-binding protein [Achromobacter insolitus]
MQPIDFFLRAAMRHPDRTATLDAATGHTHTYEELRGQTLALAAALQCLSGKPRPVVATLAGNSHAMLLGILATYACAGVLVPLTPTVVEQDIARQLATAAPDLVLHDAAYEELLVSYRGPRICHDEGHDLHIDALLREYAGQSPSRPNPDLGDTAAIKFTGGSSGAPKAVLQSLRCINAMVASLAMAYGFDSEERFLLAPPMTHGAGTFVLPVLHAGGCLVIAGKATAEQLHAWMDAHEVTSTWVPPTLLQRLVQAQGAAPRTLAALRNLLYGGAPCPTSLLSQAIAAFGPVLGVTYGLTEAPVIIAGMDGVTGSQAENHGSAGRIGPLTRVAVVGADGRPTANPHTLGEIIASGDLLMSGYLNMPEQTAAVLKDGWFHTGDLGYLDERGFLFIKGRSKDIIISGGFNVYPSDVENAYAQHPGVAESVVFGVADDYWGERVEMAVVPVRPGSISVEALIDYGKQQLGSVRTPKIIHIVQSFPKNTLGKIDKRRIIDDLRDANRQEEHRS